MESVEGRKIRILISFKKEIDYLKSISVKNDHDLFYETVIYNLLSVILDDSDTRGCADDSLDIAREMLTNHFSDSQIAVNISDTIIDMLIFELTSYIPDLDAPKYKNNFTYSIMKDYVIINIGNLESEMKLGG